LACLLKALSNNKYNTLGIHNKVEQRSKKVKSQKCESTFREKNPVEAEMEIILQTFSMKVLSMVVKMS
jgi:hypothetical protein